MPPKGAALTGHPAAEQKWHSTKKGTKVSWTRADVLKVAQACLERFPAKTAASLQNGTIQLKKVICLDNQVEGAPNINVPISYKDIGNNFPFLAGTAARFGSSYIPLNFSADVLLMCDFLLCGNLLNHPSGQSKTMHIFSPKEDVSSSSLPYCPVQKQNHAHTFPQALGSCHFL